MKIVAVVPALNEAPTIGAVVNELRAVLTSTTSLFEIWVLDDNSYDGTDSIAISCGANVRRLTRWFPLAAVFAEGMILAIERRADLVVHLDADGQYCANDLHSMLAALDGGSQLVLGSRFLGTIERMSPATKIGNRALTRVASSISGLKLSDTQTGFRLFTRAVAEIPLPAKFTYTQAQIICSARQGVRISEVPIRFRARTHGSSRLVKLKPIAGAKMLVDMFRASTLNNSPRRRITSIDVLSRQREQVDA